MPKNSYRRTGDRLFRCVGIAAAVIGWMLSASSFAHAQAEQILLPKDELPPTRVGDWPGHFAVKPTTPAENKLTLAKAELGRKLFFDGRLSGDQTVSCATCHRPDHGFASPDPLAKGIRGQIGSRNAPSLLNRAYGQSFFWDGRASTLEEQSLQPIENPVEMGASLEQVLQRLRKDASYVAGFQQAFPEDFTDASSINSEMLAAALASFQRTLLLGDSPVDLFQAGSYSALSAKERQGLWIFESRGKCWKCHQGDNYTDEKFHNIGVSFEQHPADVGRQAVTKREADSRAFKTPSLRGAGLTAPYMHNGSLKTLREVVEFYNLGGNPQDPLVDPLLEPLGLTDEEIEQLVAFLQALSKSNRRSESR